MKLAIVADLHIGNHRVQGGAYECGVNERCQATIDVLERALEIAAEEGCEEFIVAGDLFDTAKPPAQLIAPVMALFNWAVSAKSMTIRLLVGNHDQSSADPRDNALMAFAYAGLADVISIPTETGGVLYVPFRAGNMLEWVEECIEGRNPRIIVAHHGIIKHDTPPWLAESQGAVHLEKVKELMARCGAQAYFSGDWHEWFQCCTDDYFIAQIGALCPTGYDNPGDEYGNLLVVDTGEPTHVRMREVPGPRFHKVEDQYDAARLLDKNPSNYVRCVTGGSVKEELVSDHGRRFTVQKPKAKPAELRASYTGTSINQAVEAYVKTLELEDAQRGRVLDGCRKYIA